MNPFTIGDQYITLQEESELLRQILNELKDEITAMREIVMGDGLRTLPEDDQVPFSGSERKNASDTSVSTEMQLLRQEVERVRKEILKTRNHINGSAPAYECNLNMLNAAIQEINELKEESSILRERLRYLKGARDMRDDDD